jgi:erythronate-4-phosphate dehydrogenase
MENSNLKIIIERNVPFVKGLLEPYAAVQYLAADDITADAVKDIDAMIIRTRTTCNASLLGNSKCKFIATATIGTDHIDKAWCAANGITAVNAPGCNAPAVAQYVLASALRLVDKPAEQCTIGIVGVGHVGSIVERWAQSLGMTVLPCDPPRQRAEGGSKWANLDAIADKADIITFHTPLTKDGEDATYHLGDAEFFGKLKRKPIVINSARGPIVDNEAIVAALQSGQVSHAVIDCWEGEPAINDRLLALADIATPHIAGYSREGKIRASQMAVTQLCHHFGLPELAVAETLPADAPATVTAEQVLKSYNPLIDTDILKSSPETFEKQRNTYNLRPEV